MNMDDEMRKELDDLNHRAVTRVNGGQHSAEPRHDFVSLGEKVAQAMVRAAEEQVTQAQNKLAEIQAWADGLSQEVRAKDRELADMTDRIRTFGETVLEANRRFHAAVTERDSAEP